MNMFKPTKEQSIAAYLAAVPADRKDMINFLHDFIQKAVPKLKPHFATNMIGYGSFPCRNYKKELIEWPLIGLANQKNYVSIYVCAVDAGAYLAERHKDTLGKVSVGKSCIRFKKLEDINLPGFKKVLKLAEKSPGFVGVGEHSK